MGSRLTAVSASGNSSTNSTSSSLDTVVTSSQAKNADYMSYVVQVQTEGTVTAAEFTCMS